MTHLPCVVGCGRGLNGQSAGAAGAISVVLPLCVDVL